MNKIKLFIILILGFLHLQIFSISPNRITTYNDSVIEQQIIQHDTTLVLLHPDSKDSLMVVDIVKGAVNITTVFVQRPWLRQLLQSEYFYGGIVAIVLGIWRKIELRRLRRRGRYYKKLDTNRP